MSNSESDTEIREGLCNRFTLAQGATGLSKAEFAKRVGLTPSQLSNISRYRNPPSHEAIHRAIREFGFTSDWFYVGNKSGFRDPSLVQRLRETEESRS
jgi:transcriptional regulator with XRE-family HTH domain